MTRYEGHRTNAGPTVTVNGESLDPRLDLRNHSPSGLEWGYAGSGPAQLALAILADHLKNDSEAIELYQGFKFAVVASLPKNGWILTSKQIDEALQSLPCMSAKLPLAKLRLGQIVATRNALTRLNQEDILKAISRHQAGDWGTLDNHDWEANEHALQNGGRLLSRYETDQKVIFWVITEADRSVTTVLLPEDY